MAKISLIKKTGEIAQILLTKNETCPIEHCDHMQSCAGRNSNRDNGFICNLKELILLYESSKKIVK